MRTNTKPRAYWDEEEPESEGRLTIEVHEDDPEWTGLYDQHGNPIYRQKAKIGFV